MTKEELEKAKKAYLDKGGKVTKISQEDLKNRKIDHWQLSQVAITPSKSKTFYYNQFPIDRGKRRLS